MKHISLGLAVATALYIHAVAHATPASSPVKPAKRQAAAREAAAAAQEAAPISIEAPVSIEAPADAAADTLAKEYVDKLDPATEAAINAQLREAVLEDIYFDVMSPLRPGVGNPIPHLERMTRQPHAPDVAELVMRAFGTPALLTVRRSAAGPGKTAFTFSSPARQFDTLHGYGMSWGALSSTMRFDTEGRDLSWSGKWDTLTTMEPHATLALTGMSLTAAQRRNADDTWLGTTVVQIARAVVDIADEKSALVINGAEMNHSVTEQGKLVDIAFDVRARNAVAFGEQVEQLRLVARLSNVDAREFDKITFSTERMRVMMAPSAFGREMRDAYTAFARGAAARGATLHFDEISMAYKGHKLLATGKVSLVAAQDDDFSKLWALGQKLHARFDVKLPMALLTEISAAAARRQEALNAAAARDPAAAAEAASALTSRIPPPPVTEGMVKQMVGSGFAVLADGMLSTSLELRQGAVFINGKPIARDAQASPAPRKDGKRPAAGQGKAKQGKARK